jgi:hypothetical protein
VECTLITAETDESIMNFRLLCSLLSSNNLIAHFSVLSQSRVSCHSSQGIWTFVRSISLHWASYHSTIYSCCRGHRPCVNLVFHSQIKHSTINIFFIARDLTNKGQRSEGLLQVSLAGAWISWISGAIFLCHCRCCSAFCAVLYFLFWVSIFCIVILFVLYGFCGLLSPCVTIIWFYYGALLLYSSVLDGISMPFFQ